MPKYKIGVYEEQGGYMIVEAKNLVQAKKKALRHVDDNGFDSDVDVTTRDVMIIDWDKISS